MDTAGRVDKASKKNKRRVVVICDGCADYSNRACVHNCPAGALKAVTVKDFMSSSKGFISFELKELLRHSLIGSRDKRKYGTG